MLNYSIRIFNCKTTEQVFWDDSGIMSTYRDRIVSKNSLKFVQKIKKKISFTNLFFWLKIISYIAKKCRQNQREKIRLGGLHSPKPPGLLVLRL